MHVLNKRDLNPQKFKETRTYDYMSVAAPLSCYRW